MPTDAFVERVFRHLPASTPPAFKFDSWSHADKPTQEGVGVLAISGFDPTGMIARIMDVGHYQGNINHVEESRAVADPNYVLPEAVRFYQRINVPVLARIHMELVLTDLGQRGAWHVIAWHQFDEATGRLDPKVGARSAYNDGAWLIGSGVVGYALSSAPRKDDVGRLKFAALTKGADAAAGRMVKANIEGMVAWARRA